MREIEKLYLKCNSHEIKKKRNLRQNYKNAQNELDKRIRFFERKYRKELSTDIESAVTHTSDPRRFWSYIKRLGPTTKNNFPKECYKSGEIHTEPEIIKEVWTDAFQQLYNPKDNNSFDDEFITQAKSHKEHVERLMLDPLYEPNAYLNRQIDLNEVREVVQKSKAGKSPGIDELPYEVLKSDSIIILLHKLFLLVFDTNLIPSIWLKAIICPILKDKNSDPRIPLNYRGISLQCATAKNLQCGFKQQTHHIFRR